MDLRRALLALGTGATAFLVVTVATLELLGGGFLSIFVALSVGLAAAAGAALTLDADAPRPVQSGAAGVAAFAYVLLGLWSLRYSVAAVRPTLSFAVIVAASAVLAVAVVAVAWVCPPVLRDGGGERATGSR